MKKTIVIGFIAALFMTLPAQAGESEYTAIKGGTIVPVTGDNIPQGILLIKDDRIEALGADVPIPEGARVIDAAGMFVYPGMIDA